MDLQEVDIDRKKNFNPLKIIIVVIVFIFIINIFNPYLWIYGTKTIEVEVINFPNYWIYSSYILFKLLLAVLLVYFSGVFLFVF
jgi:hypothetical protein